MAMMGGLCREGCAVAFDFNTLLDPAALKKVRLADAERDEPAPKPKSAARFPFTMQRGVEPDHVDRRDRPQLTVERKAAEFASTAPTIVLEMMRQAAADPVYSSMFQAIAAHDVPGKGAAYVRTLDEVPGRRDSHFALWGKGFCILSRSGSELRLEPVDAKDLCGFPPVRVGELLQNLKDTLLEGNMQPYIGYAEPPSSQGSVRRFLTFVGLA